MKPEIKSIEGTRLKHIQITIDYYGVCYWIYGVEVDNIVIWAKGKNQGDGALYSCPRSKVPNIVMETAEKEASKRML